MAIRSQSVLKPSMELGLWHASPNFSALANLLVNDAMHEVFWCWFLVLLHDSPCDTQLNSRHKEVGYCKQARKLSNPLVYVTVLSAGV
jgi:hypothetical protein